MTNYAIGVKDTETGKVFVSRAGRRYATRGEAVLAKAKERDSKWHKHVLVNMKRSCFSLVGPCKNERCVQCRGR